MFGARSGCSSCRRAFPVPGDALTPERDLRFLGLGDPWRGQAWCWRPVRAVHVCRRVPGVWFGVVWCSGWPGGEVGAGTARACSLRMSMPGDGRVRGFGSRAV
jgi:hypothetical protein